MYYTVHDTSLQYAVTYNTLQVVVYPTNNRYLGILRLRCGGGGGARGDAHNISGFYAHCLGLNAAFYMCQIKCEFTWFDSNNKV
jgi:hypothetical protein